VIQEQGSKASPPPHPSC